MGKSEGRQDLAALGDLPLCSAPGRKPLSDWNSRIVSGKSLTGIEATFIQLFSPNPGKVVLLLTEIFIQSYIGEITISKRYPQQYFDKEPCSSS